MCVKLSEQYKIERAEICNKLINILKLDDNLSFILCELDDDTAKQTSILNMKDEIQT